MGRVRLCRCINLILEDRAVACKRWIWLGTWKHECKQGNGLTLLVHKGGMSDQMVGNKTNNNRWDGIDHKVVSMDIYCCSYVKELSYELNVCYDDWPNYWLRQRQKTFILHSIVRFGYLIWQIERKSRVGGVEKKRKWIGCTLMREMNRGILKVHHKFSCG